MEKLSKPEQILYNICLKQAEKLFMKEVENIHQELKYYTPEISDIHTGYICEYNKSDRTDDEDWGPITILYQDFYNGVISDFGIANLQNLRTPYLNKSQIEKEGWKHVGGKLMSTVGQEYEYKGWDLTHSELNQNVLIERKNYIRDGSGNWNDKTTYFRGKLNSINELTYICKLLNIK
jgi:hypothetical protein